MNGFHLLVNMACDYPVILFKDIPFPHLLPVPCLKCAGCRKDRISAWADRLAFEDLTSPCGSSFLTLTFDDAHLPFNRSADKSHMTLFFKRLRYFHSKNSDSKFKYFYTSEYGDLHYRLHYHVILNNFDSGSIQNVQDIASAWADKAGNRLGIAQLGALKPGGIRYVTEYMSYENPKLSAAYQAIGLSPLVHHMSKGIGKNWILAHRDDIIASDGYFSNGVLRPLPYYWKNQLGMIKKYEYVDRLDDIWKKYNDILKFRGFSPVNPTNPVDFCKRGLADMVGLDDRRSWFQKLVGDEGRELFLAGDFVQKNQVFSPSLGINTIYAQM